MRELTPVSVLALSLLATSPATATDVGNMERYHVTVSIQSPAATPAERTRSISQPVLRTASGTIINEAGFVVTAAHVARSQANAARIRDSGGASYQARILRVIPDSDVAILRIEGPWRFRVAPAPVSSQPESGTRVTAFGIESRGSRAATRVGVVGSPNAARKFRFGEFSFRDPIILDMTAQRGFSGGPVFDDQGRWLGMLAGYAVEKSANGSVANAGEAYVIPAERILGFID